MRPASGLVWAFAGIPVRIRGTKLECQSRTGQTPGKWRQEPLIHRSTAALRLTLPAESPREARTRVTPPVPGVVGRGRRRPVVACGAFPRGRQAGHRPPDSLRGTALPEAVALALGRRAGLE